MELLHKVEKSLEEPFASLPPLPKDLKKGLASIWPWLALIAGVLQLLAAWWLYDWAKYYDKLVDWTNSISTTFGGATVDSRLTAWVWIAVVMLAVDGIILLLAFPRLQKKLKSGWDLLLLAALINLAYGVISLFIDGRGGMGSLLGALIGSAIGFYLLFQVREYFGGKPLVNSSATKPESSKKADSKK